MLSIFYLKNKHHYDGTKNNGQLQELCRLSRYIDDILAVDAPNILKLQNLSDYNSTLKIRGIYPDTLVLKTTASGTSVDYLDVTITHSHPDAVNNTTLQVHPVGWLITHLYDKRRGPAYASIKYITYPDIDSALNLSTKLSIITSQFRRFNRIITDYPNFIAEKARLVYYLVDIKHYPRQGLLRRLRHCCFTAIDFYGQTNGRILFSAITAVEVAMANEIRLRQSLPSAAAATIQLATETFKKLFPPTSTFTHKHPCNCCVSESSGALGRRPILPHVYRRRNIPGTQTRAFQDQPSAQDHLAFSESTYLIAASHGKAAFYHNFELQRRTAILTAAIAAATGTTALGD